MKKGRRPRFGTIILWVVIIVVLFVVLVFVINAVKYSKKYDSSGDERVYFNPVTEDSFGWAKLRELLRLENPFVVKENFEDSERVEKG